MSKLTKQNIDSIKRRIEALIENGMINKDEIYTIIVDEFDIARPIVRRIARELRIELQNKIKILQSDLSYLKEKSN